MRLGFTKNRVLPLPEPPITSTFLFLAVLGSLGRLFMVRRSVCVSRILLSNTGSMYGAISLGPPQRALPYSTPRRYFLAFLPFRYTISRSSAAPVTPISRSKPWKLGEVQQLFRNIRPGRQPVCLPQLAEQIDKQEIGQVGNYQFFYFWLHSDSPLSLTFSLARCFSLAAAFCFMADRVFRMEGRSSRFSFLAVNSLNACSRLSACLVLKITI